jgi:hypothetical protein
MRSHILRLPWVQESPVRIRAPDQIAPIGSKSHENRTNIGYLCYGGEGGIATVVVEREVRVGERW